MDAWRVSDLDELEDETLRTGEHAETARRLARLADGGKLDAVSRAEVLARAGRQWQLAGNPDAARQLYQGALDDGGDVQGDARAHLADALFELGDGEGARSLLAQLREAQPIDPAVYHSVAETLEAHRDLAGAAEWATAGIRICREQRPDPHTLDMLLRTRFRVRRDMGLGEDEYDELLDSSPATGNT